MYDISFDFTNPKDPKDVNHMITRDHNYENYMAWMQQILISAFRGTWIISHLTITKHQ